MDEDGSALASHASSLHGTDPASVSTAPSATEATGSYVGVGGQKIEARVLLKHYKQGDRPSSSSTPSRGNHVSQPEDHPSSAEGGEDFKDVKDEEVFFVCGLVNGLMNDAVTEHYGY